MKVYIRRKEPGKGWRYRPVPKIGRPPQRDESVKFHVRYRDAAGKYVWSQGYNTLEEARKASAGLELNANGIAQTLYYRWKDEAEQGAKAALGGRSAAAMETEKDRRIRQLERTLGRKSLEIEILKNVVGE